ncbi:MAG: TonB-dependent receptor [Pseudomonadales bacterium]|nr:TonB-dependent receptor [Pseudomonadales bacterium]
MKRIVKNGNQSEYGNGRKKRLGAISLISLFSVPGGVLAETADDAGQISRLPTISVTATRTEQKSVEVPASLTHKSKLEIQLDSPVQQKELFNSMAGVRVTQTGSTVGHMTSIRMPVNTGPYYLFLQDGIPVQSSGFYNHNGLAYTNYSSAGSTEVLKGAGTALYGSDAIAATINVRSIEPYEEQGQSISVEGGSDEFWRVGVSSGGAISEAADLSSSFSHMQNAGWREHTDSSRQELSIKHVQALSDDSTLKTHFSINHTTAEMAGSLIGRDALENNRESIGDLASILERGLDPKRKFDFARLSSEWVDESKKDVRLSAIAYLRSNRNRYTATWEPSLPQNDTKTRSLGLMLKSDITRGQALLIPGIDIEYTQASRTYSQLFDFVPDGFGSPVASGEIYNYDVNYAAIAPYIRTEYSISDRLQIAGGLRYDVNRFNYTNNTEDGQYASSSFARPSDDNDPTFNHLSPKLDLTYQLAENRQVYLRYANAFRIPQATRLYSLKTNNIAFTLDPETSDTFDMGYKLVQDKYAMDFSLYYMVINDTIVRRENESRDRYYVNGGDTLHKGVELSLSVKMSPAFSSKVAYSYSKHEFDNDIVYGNNEQEQAPRDVANIRLFYQPQAIKNFVAMVEWEHVGSWWLDDENTEKYEGSDRGNIKFTYKPNTELTLFGKVNNMTDEVYAESASISYGKEKYTPGGPRQYSLGVKFSL